MRALVRHNNVMIIISTVILRLTVKDSMIPNWSLLLSACLDYNQSTSLTQIKDFPLKPKAHGWTGQTKNLLFIYFRVLNRLRSYLMWGEKNTATPHSKPMWFSSSKQYTNNCYASHYKYEVNLMLCMLWAFGIYLEYTWQPSPPLPTNTTWYFSFIYSISVKLVILAPHSLLFPWSR